MAAITTIIIAIAAFFTLQCYAVRKDDLTEEIERVIQNMQDKVRQYLREIKQEAGETDERLKEEVLKIKENATTTIKDMKNTIKDLKKKAEDADLDITKCDLLSDDRIVLENITKNAQECYDYGKSRIMKTIDEAKVSWPDDQAKADEFLERFRNCPNDSCLTIPGTNSVPSVGINLQEVECTNYCKSVVIMKATLESIKVMAESDKIYLKTSTEFMNILIEILPGCFVKANNDAVEEIKNILEPTTDCINKILSENSSISNLRTNYYLLFIMCILILILKE